MSKGERLSRSWFDKLTTNGLTLNCPTLNGKRKTRPEKYLALLVQKLGRKTGGLLFYELNAAFALIAENSELGVACDYIREGYRHFHINRHLVFYRVAATKIHIVRVLHDSMNYTAHL